MRAKRHERRVRWCRESRVADNAIREVMGGRIPDLRAKRGQTPWVFAMRKGRTYQVSGVFMR